MKKEQIILSAHPLALLDRMLCPLPSLSWTEEYIKTYTTREWLNRDRKLTDDVAFITHHAQEKIANQTIGQPN